VAAAAPAGHNRVVTDRHAREAERRWGRTVAFQESQRRAAGYRPDDWARIQTEATDLEGRLAQAMLAGWAADSPPAMDLAEEHRDHLSRWFYRCGPDLHRALGDLYVEDPRFARHYDDRTPGLARFVRAAIHANADRQH